MADSKVSGLPTLSVVAGEDYLLVIDDPSGTPVSKKVRADALFGLVVANTNITGSFTSNNSQTFRGANTNIWSGNTTITANTTVKGNLTVTTDKIRIRTAKTPSSNTDSEGQGSIYWDSNYLYIAVGNAHIKRISLEVF